MPIDPRIGSIPGDLSGVSLRLGDLDRRLRAVESTSTQIGVNAITTTQIGVGAVGAGNIAANSIYAASIQAGAVTTSALAANSVTAVAIAANSINASKIVANTITATQIAAHTITATEIAAGAITATAILAGTITAHEIAADTITANEIAANAITASELAANAVTAVKILAGTITANEIAATSIDASRLNVTTLQSITTNMGSLTAGTITGATVQSASGTGTRVVLDSTGIHGYNASNTLVFDLSTGTGIVSMTGTATITAGAVAGSIITGTIPVGVVPPVGGGNALRNSFFSLGAGAAGTGLWSTQAGTWTYPTGVTDAWFGTTVAQTASLSTNCIIDYNFNGVYVPAQPGVNYIFSAYMRSLTSASGTGLVRLVYRDSGGTVLATNDSATVSMTTAWQRVSVSATAPAGTATIRASLRPTTGASVQIQVSAAQLEQGSLITAYSPRPDEILPGTVTGGSGGMIAATTITATEIASGAITTAKMTANTINGNVITAATLDATKIIAATITATQIATGTITATVMAAGAITTQKLGFTQPSANLLYDSGFEFTTDPITSADIRGWQASTNAGPVTNGTSSPLFGSKYGILTVSTAAPLAYCVAKSTNWPVVSAGNDYTLSIYFRNINGVASRRGSVSIEYLDASNTVVTGPTGTQTALSVTTSVWTRVSLTATAPATAVKARCYYQVGAVTGNLSVAEAYHVDGAMFEAGGTAVAPSAVWTPREGEVQPGSVGNTQLAADSITTDKILAGTIVASDITVATLAAIQANLGTITAGDLTAVAIHASTIDSTTVTSTTITGGLVRTAASGARLQMNGTSNAFEAFDSTPTNTMSLTGSQGLQFLAGTGITAENPRTITWNETIGGREVGRVKSYRDPLNTNWLFSGPSANSGENAYSVHGTLDVTLGTIRSGVTSYAGISSVNDTVNVVIAGIANIVVANSGTYLQTNDVTVTRNFFANNTATVGGNLHAQSSLDVAGALTVSSITVYNAGVSDFVQKSAGINGNGGVGGGGGGTTWGASVGWGFTLNRASNVLLFFSGTGYVGSAPTTAYLDHTLDGTYIGSQGMYFNTAGEHTTMPTAMYYKFCTAGSHSLGMGAGGNLMRDFNDANCFSYIAF